MPIRQRALKVGPLDNNAFVLWCEESRACAIVDVGFDPEVVIGVVRELGLETIHLLNTHAHYDHAAAMREVQETLGGAYWLHPADQPLLDRLTEQGAMFGLPPAQPPEIVNPLADGQRIAIGRESLEVIHTPGHSPGGVCFRWNDDLWVGDTLFQGSIGRTDLPGGSFERLERSIHERLFPLGDSTRVYTGHGPFTTIGQERETNPFVGGAAG